MDSRIIQDIAKLSLAAEHRLATVLILIDEGHCQTIDYHIISYQEEGDQELHPHQQNITV